MLSREVGPSDIRFTGVDQSYKKHFRDNISHAIMIDLQPLLRGNPNELLKYIARNENVLRNFENPAYDAEERIAMLERYEMKNNADAILRQRTTTRTCQECGSSQTSMFSKEMYICGNCDAISQRQTPITSSDFTPHDMPRDNYHYLRESRNTYKSLTHLTDWLRRIQAIHSPEITSINLETLIATALNNMGLLTDATRHLINHELIHEILRSHKLPKYYEYVPYYTYAFNPGYKRVEISLRNKQQLAYIFFQVIRLYQQLPAQFRPANLPQFGFLLSLTLPRIGRQDIVERMAILLRVFKTNRIRAIQLARWAIVEPKIIWELNGNEDAAAQNEETVRALTTIRMQSQSHRNR